MKIAVIGDSCKDVFQYGNTPRLSPEAPCPVFIPTHKSENTGMAGNVVANLRSCGAEEVDLFTQEEVITKTRFVDKKTNQMIMRMDENDIVRNSFILSETPLGGYDAIVVSDYNKGYLSIDNIRYISYASNKVCFLDTKKPLGDWAFGFDFIKINESEWENSKKCGAKEEDWFDKLIVTLGERGCMFKGKIYPTNAAEIIDVSGAGDSFLAALVYFYLQSNNIHQAIDYANECASLVVRKKGVATIY